MSEPGKAVFLSYASQDAETAKRICDTLRAAGVEVWFDQSELVGGDAWDQKIRKQIKDCALLIPIISAATQARTEGYFRLEWRLADQRTHLMAKGRPFLLPVVIDDTRDADAQVPDSFTEVQWTRLKSGETTPAFCARVKKLLGGSEMEAGRPRPADKGSDFARAATDREGTPAPGRSPRWRMPVFAGVVIAAIALVLARPWEKSSPRSEPTKSAAVVPPTAAPLSEARELIARAQAIMAKGGLTRAQLDTAGELCDRALQLDSTDAIVWNEAAHADLLQIHPYGYDRTDERRKRAQFRAMRALDLAPDRFEVRAMQAAVMAHAGGSPALLKEAEATFRELIVNHPDDRELVIQLAEVLREQKRFDEAATLFEKIGEFEVAGWSYFVGGSPRAALAAVNRSLGEKRAVTALQLKALLQLDVGQDLDAAQATIDQLRPSELLAELPAAPAIQGALFRRDPVRLLEIVQALPADYLNSNAFRGPRQFFTGLAHEMAGRTGAAVAEWRAGLAVVQERLKAAPDDRELVLWAAWLQAALGAKAEAVHLLDRAQKLADLDSATADARSAKVFLRLGQNDAVLAWLTAFLHARAPQWESAHAEARFSPIYDSLRGDPRFEKLLRDNLPEGAKPFDRAQGRPFDDPKPQTLDPGPTDRPAVDQKSVAVLAFANLSDDKANEYFSDGITEELLNVLAKIPDLKVAARTSAFYFKGKEVPIPEIAKQLGVAYVVEGSVRKAGDKVRITAQLIKASDGFHVWSDTFTRDIKDVFAVQDEIAGLIARNISPMLNTTQVARVREIAPDAYQEYLLGRSAVAKAVMADLRESLVHFERAVAIEPKFTAAWVQLANAHTRLGRWGGAPAISSWQAARAAIDRAVALEPDSPEVLVALGWILRTGEWKWREAERAFRRALELRPNQPDVLAGAAVLLYNIGQTEEAMRLGQRAAQLDPLNASTQIDLSIMFYLHGDLAEAETAARRALQLAPDGASYHAILAWSLIDQKRFAEAEAEIALDPDPVEQPTAYGRLALARGDEATARKMITQLEELARTNPDAADLQQSIAWICAGIGEKENDRSFAALERAKASRDPSMAWLLSSRYLLPLQSDPRWEKLKRSMGLAEDQLK